MEEVVSKFSVRIRCSVHKLGTSTPPTPGGFSSRGLRAGASHYAGVAVVSTRIA